MTRPFVLVMVMAMPQTQPVSEILQAKYSGNTQRVEELLAARPALNIFEASATGQTARVRELIATDRTLVNTYAPDGFHPLGLAAFFGNRATVEVLLEAGADVNQQSRESMKVSALHSASAARRPDLVELLLTRGANPNARAESGITPLHEAAATGKIDIGILLVKHGGNINAKDDHGKTPLAHAINNNQDAMAVWLEARGGV